MNDVIPAWLVILGAAAAAGVSVLTLIRLAVTPILKVLNTIEEHTRQQAEARDDRNELRHLVLRSIERGDQRHSAIDRSLASIHKHLEMQDRALDAHRRKAREDTDVD